MTVPSYLRDHADLYATDPRAAAIEWFRNTRYGLFLHYGLYSLLGRHEWVQLRELIRVDEYAKLMDDFAAENFDADYIADFAVDCGMKYINITTRHHDSFCLFDTKETPFNSVQAPNCGRDLVGELAAACEKRSLGLFLYYSHGRDWKHPHAPNNDEWGGSARPKYDPPDPTYATVDDHDLNKYLDFMSAQITELLTNYGPIAGIWLDGIAVPRQGPTEKFKTQEMYDLVHSLQPQVLVSYKQGLLGTEDFYTPEHKIPEAGDESKAGTFFEGGKPFEICTTITPGSWGWLADNDAPRRTPDNVMEELKRVGAAGGSVLLNTGPRPDGSLEPLDVEPLREVGARIRAQGYPG